jgi:hypothetical protein
MDDGDGGRKGGSAIWRIHDGLAVAETNEGVAWTGAVDAGAVVTKVLPIQDSNDAVVLLDPDSRPAGVLKWHPFFNLLRLSPEGGVVWRADLVPGDTWKVFLDVEWQDEVLRASAASYKCTLDPSTGRIIETAFVK